MDCFAPNSTSLSFPHLCNVSLLQDYSSPIAAGCRAYLPIKMATNLPSRPSSPSGSKSIIVQALQLHVLNIPVLVRLVANLE